MTLYAFILYLHFLGVVVLFLAIGIEIAANSFLRRSATLEEARTWLRLARLGPLLNGPALGVLILTGGYLAYLLSAMRQGWIPASLLGIGLVFLLGITVNVPRMTRVRKALTREGATLDSGTVALLGDPLLAASTRVRALTALAIVLLMTAKLPFQDSLLALAGGALLGVVLAVPLWTGR